MTAHGETTLATVDVYAAPRACLKHGPLTSPEPCGRWLTVFSPHPARESRTHPLRGIG